MAVSNLSYCVVHNIELYKITIINCKIIKTNTKQIMRPSRPNFNIKNTS